MKYTLIKLGYYEYLSLFKRLQRFIDYGVEILFSDSEITIKLDDDTRYTVLTNLIEVYLSRHLVKCDKKALKWLTKW